jgi:serine acetyltransferase
VERAVTATELPFWQLVRADVQATTHANFKLYSDTRFWLRAMAKLVVSPNVRAVLTYRIAHELAKKRLLPLALLLRSRGIRTSGAELNPLARIGPGLYLVHSIGVGIGAYVVIGANCKIHLGVVIGPRRRPGPCGSAARTTLSQAERMAAQATPSAVRSTTETCAQPRLIPDAPCTE